MQRLTSVLLISMAIAAIAIGCAKQPGDAQLTTNIKAQLFSDPQTKDTNLEVAVKDGVATLSGTVPNNGARYEAYKIAASTPGVTKVEDQMNVQAPAESAQVTPAPVAPAPPRPAEEKKASRREAHPRKEHRTRAAHHTRSAPSQPALAPAKEPDASALPVARANAPAAQTPAPAQTPPPPQPITAQFAAGTTIQIQTIDSIDAGKNSPGDEFQASLATPLTSNGRVVVPAGANVYLRMVAASDAGKFKGRSVVQLQLVRLEFQGKEYPLVSDTYTDEGASRGKNTAEKVGGGAALGALIGAIAGGGKGAAIGGAIGAGGGGAVQAASKVKQVHISPETKIDFALQQPLNISYLPGGKNP
ncbi:MAG TPA: BON domain-containing protein [Candidatus Acidoferrales bacterium]|nr:BON domain-containing protein [Candidatus Acidoferrales bacterium]